MEKRSPISVALLTLVTLGIYGIVWQVKTKGEMNKLGADIPTAWLLIIPIVNIYWLWKYSEGVERVTKGQLSAILSFVVMYLVGFVGMAIVQDSFNKIGEVAASTTANTEALPQYGAPTTHPPAAEATTTAIVPAPAPQVAATPPVVPENQPTSNTPQPPQV